MLLDEDDSKLSDRPTTFAKVLKVSAYPLAAASAYIYGRRGIRDGLYDSLKKRGVFDDELAYHNEKFRAILPPPGIAKDISEEFAPLHREFSEQVTKQFHDLGFTNTRKCLKGLHDTKKLNTLMTAVTAAGITLAAVLTIADSKTKFTRLLKTDEEQEAERARM